MNVGKIEQSQNQKVSVMVHYKKYIPYTIVELPHAQNPAQKHHYLLSLTLIKMHSNELGYADGISA